MKNVFVCLIIFTLKFSNLYAQKYFNKLYRFDSLQQVSMQFSSMIISDNDIYTSGIGAIIDSIYIDDLGFCSRFSLSGELKKQQYYGKYPKTVEFRSSNLIKVSDKYFAAAGLNQDSSFSLIMLDSNCNRIFQKEYKPKSNQYYFFIPYSITLLQNRDFAVVVPVSYDKYLATAVVITDSMGNQKSLFEYPVSAFYNNQISKKILNTRSDNLLLISYNFPDIDIIEPTFKIVTQLREIDTAGLVVWEYNTPSNRYIYGNSVQQLSNGNFLIWGKEDYPRKSGRFQVYDSKAYISEVNKNNGVLWERHFDFGIGSNFTDVKILKDSSILAVGDALTLKDTTSYGILFKMNNRHDSVFTRYLHNQKLRTSYSNESRLVQLETLKNGDLIMAGHFFDTKRSPTQGQWGWLMHTDSLGCFASNCGITTIESIENTSLNLFPNPSNSAVSLQIENLNNANYDVSVFNSLGERIYFGFNISSFEVNNFPNGLYIVKVKISNKEIIKKIIIQH